MIQPSVIEGWPAVWTLCGLAGVPGTFALIFWAAASNYRADKKILQATIGTIGMIWSLVMMAVTLAAAIFAAITLIFH